MKRGILYDRELVVAAVDRAKTQTDALRLLGLSPQADNYRRLRESCTMFDLDVPSVSLTSSIAAIDEALLLDLKQQGATAQEILRATGHPVKPATKAALRDRWVEMGVAPAVERRRPPKSPLQDRNAVERAVSEATSMAAALAMLGMAPARKNYDALEVACKGFDLVPPARRANGAGRKPAQAESSKILKVNRGFAKWRTPESEARALALIADGLLASEVLTALAIPKSQAAYLWLREVAEAHEVVIQKRALLRLESEEVLSRGSTHGRQTVKRYALAHKDIASDACSECGQCPVWNGKPLTFHLDHINGDTTDNRPANLRFLCPNCHSQTETYCRMKGATVGD